MTITATKATLPDKPSALLTLAMKDLKKIEKSTHYEVFMEEWHEPSRGGRFCSVCLAGSVIANTLKSTKDKGLIPADYDMDTENKLNALDEFRQGRVTRALKCMDIAIPKQLKEIYKVASYSDGCAKFKSDMNKIIARLKKAGI